MKPLLIVSSLIGLICAFDLVKTKSNAFLSSPLLIQSLESKTLTDEPVYNEIKWFEFKDKDVWMMNQSQNGLKIDENKKDRLAIVIDKTKNPMQAYFMQLKPGPLEWSEDLYQQKIANRVACFMCHAYGPRAIRPDVTGLVNLSTLDQLKINYFNYKIKSYGRIIESEKHLAEDLKLAVPFRYRASFENETLGLETCVKCHDGDNRNHLTRQNAISISFLVRNNFMPGDEHNLTADEIKKIQRFTDGF